MAKPIAVWGDMAGLNKTQKDLRNVLLSETEHKPDIGIIHVSEPLDKALLGSALEDEIEVDLGGGMTRTGVIERIERAPAVAA